MRNLKKENVPKVMFGLAYFTLITWIAIRIAPHLEGNAFTFLQKDFAKILFHRPFQLVWVEKTPATILFFWIISILVGLTVHRSGTWRKGEEHGSSRWGSLSASKRKYAPKNGAEGKILSSQISMDLNSWTHQRNLNTLVIGGSGAGKTRGFVKPNLYQANSSYVILDPAGEILRDSGSFLLAQGYKIKILNLDDMSVSMRYNAYEYAQSPEDIVRLIKVIVKATTPRGQRSSDPFWDKAEQMLFTALALLVYEIGEPEEKCLDTVMYLLSKAEVKESNEDYVSVLDELFQDIAREREQAGEESLAVHYYRQYKGAAGETAKSINITMAARLQPYFLPQVKELTRVDELELDKLGDEKMALFFITPVTDDTFNFLVSAAYMQLFDRLYRKGNKCPHNLLPIPVQIYMDEFANVALPDDFPKVLSTVRKYGISCNIILQSLSQLKALYKDDWEGIVGNCDTSLYLGGNEQESHKYWSEALGKETIHSNSWGKSHGKSGSSSINEQLMARELLQPNEIRKLSRDYCLLLISGEDPLMDRKFVLKKHPQISHTADGGGKTFDCKAYIEKLHGTNDDMEDSFDEDELESEDIGDKSEKNRSKIEKRISLAHDPLNFS